MVVSKDAKWDSTWRSARAPATDESSGDVDEAVDEADELLVTIATGLADCAADTELGREGKVGSVAAGQLLPDAEPGAHLPV